ncbi:MAG: GNAT family N-acetyltransferase [Actinobacteria bacterium]|nr:GNAT family N-acetyltransferase [Actinomycetota bacterium]MCA1721468.1 GNAT family N-acetyltransferase [Actinomycetota bacterium]
MLRTAGVRVLDNRDQDEVLALLARDPVADVFVASRIEAAGVDTWRLGAELWGFGERGRLESLCYSGANLVPCQATPDAVRAFGERARRQGRRCSSIVGPADAVLPLWRLLEPHWGRVRELRADQPLLTIDVPPRVEPDPEVARVRPDQVEALLPACIAMFTEEVGVSPLAGGGGALYRARVEELVAQGRAFARFDRGQVVFKAEIGAATRATAQVQGVWVHPDLRGQGTGTSGTAAVVLAAQASTAPVVSLYVNSFNTAARRSYEKVGFREVGTFASVLF